MIGDGMGIFYINVYCFLKNNGEILNNLKLIEFDWNLIGMMMMYLDDFDYNIIDLVVVGIVLVMGVKIYNNVIGVDKNGKKVKLVFEEVKQ